MCGGWNTSSRFVCRFSELDSNGGLVTRNPAGSSVNPAVVCWVCVVEKSCGTGGSVTVTAAGVGGGGGCVLSSDGADGTGGGAVWSAGAPVCCWKNGFVDTAGGVVGNCGLVGTGNSGCGGGCGGK